MLDRLYKEAQAMLNKEQMGYLPPIQYNLFVNSAVGEAYFWLLEQVRQATRRSNWLLDGKDFADHKKYYEELLEYYTDTKSYSQAITPANPTIYQDATYTLPDDFRFFLDLIRTSDNFPAERMTYKAYNSMKRNTYSPPSSCNPRCTKRGNSLLVSPIDWHTVATDKLQLFYLRKPVQANWAYGTLSDDGEAMYNESGSTEVDAPDILYDKLLNSILSKAGLKIRDNSVFQYTNLDEQKKERESNTQ